VYVCLINRRLRYAGSFHLTVARSEEPVLTVSTKPAYRRSIRYKRIAMLEFQSFSEGSAVPARYLRFQRMGAFLLLCMIRFKFSLIG
jgi:hypothetical protein